MESPESRIDKRFVAAERSKTFRNLLSTFNLREKAVLDIGCSYGEHLAHFGKRSTGLTIETAEVTEGIRRGLDIREANAEDDFTLDRTYDAVYSSNLLEHLYAPHAFLYKVRDVLKPDGILILGVPVVPFPSILLRFRKFRGSLATQHINFFVAKTLRLTVERAGWKVQTVRGFHIKNGFLDRCIGMIYPHLYVIATPEHTFSYSEKRQRELAGYR